MLLKKDYEKGNLRIRLLFELFCFTYSTVLFQIEWNASTRPLEKATDIAGFYIKPKVSIWNLSTHM